MFITLGKKGKKESCSSFGSPEGPNKDARRDFAETAKKLGFPAEVIQAELFESTRIPHHMDEVVEWTGDIQSRFTLDEKQLSYRFALYATTFGISRSDICSEIQKYNFPELSEAEIDELIAEYDTLATMRAMIMSLPIGLEKNRAVIDFVRRSRRIGINLSEIKRQIYRTDAGMILAAYCEGDEDNATTSANEREWMTAEMQEFVTYALIIDVPFITILFRLKILGYVKLVPLEGTEHGVDLCLTEFMHANLLPTKMLPRPKESSSKTKVKVENTDTKDKAVEDKSKASEPKKYVKRRTVKDDLRDGTDVVTQFFSRSKGLKSTGKEKDDLEAGGK